jgi:protein O-mannosyl-transferase
MRDAQGGRRWPVGVALLTGAAFLVTLRNGFVNFDDRASVVENPMFRGLDRVHLVWMATTFHMGHWQPLSWLSLAVDHAVWGLRPVGYHLTNVLLHAGSAAILFLVAERLLGWAGLPFPGRRVGAAVAALFWSLHPLRVEAVAWVTERREVLAGLFTLLALYAYVGPLEDHARIPRTLAAMAVATAAKASAMVLPLLLVVCDVYPLRRLGGAIGWLTPAARRVWREKVPFLALGLVSGSIALAAQRDAGALAPLAALGLAPRAGAILHGLGFHLAKTIAPIGLVPLYEYPANFGPLHPIALRSFALFAAAAVAAAALRRRCPGVPAALAAYAVALAPTLGVAQSGIQLAADRYGYLAMLGPSVLVGGLAAGGLGPRRAVLVALPMLVALGLATARQSTYWYDSETLWRHAVEVDPTNAFARANLGDTAFWAGDMETATVRFREAIALRPDFAEAHHDLAVALARRQRFEEAVAENREAIRLRPGFAAAYASLGVALANLWRDEEAIAAYRQALALDPRRADIHANLGMLLAGAGRRDEARVELERALALDPHADGARRALEALSAR